MGPDQSTDTTVTTGAAEVHPDPRPPVLAELGLGLCMLSFGAQLLHRSVKRLGGPQQAAKAVQQAASITYVETGATVEEIEGGEGSGSEEAPADLGV